MVMKDCWLVELDIHKIFDHLDYAHLRDVLRHRILDGVLQRLIGKLLNGRVLEDGCRTRPGAGSSQGGVIAPILSNV